MHVEPYYDVDHVSLARDANAQISKTVVASNRRTASLFAFSPSENAGFGVIFKKFTDSILGDFSHNLNIEKES